MIAFLKGLAVLSALISSPAQSPSPRAAPTVDISAVRYITCDRWVGSGFLIGDHIMATALHVVSDTPECTDNTTGAKLMVYKVDEKNDLALVTSPSLPTDIPYIKISCQPFVANQEYFSWGTTFYGMDSEDNAITRMNTITARAGYVNEFLDDGTPFLHGRKFDGAIAPGMSGGPVTDSHGYAHALNNAGNDDSTILHEFADGILCK